MESTSEGIARSLSAQQISQQSAAVLKAAAVSWRDNLRDANQSSLRSAQQVAPAFSSLRAARAGKAPNAQVKDALSQQDTSATSATSTPSGDAWAILTAAGSGTRFGADKPKALVTVAGRTLLVHAMSTLLNTPGVQGVVITVPPGEKERFAAEARTVAGLTRWRIVEGGPSRQASVYRGLAELPLFVADTGRVLTADSPILIHDAARAFAPIELMQRLLAVVFEGAGAVIPGLVVTDTIKVVEDANLPAGGSLVVETPRRKLLRAIQTPQTFKWQVIWRAHNKYKHLSYSEALAPTDDAALVELSGEVVRVIDGDYRAFKITVPADLEKVRHLAR